MKVKPPPFLKRLKTEMKEIYQVTKTEFRVRGKLTLIVRPAAFSLMAFSFAMQNVTYKFSEPIITVIDILRFPTVKYVPCRSFEA